MTGYLVKQLFRPNYLVLRNYGTEKIYPQQCPSPTSPEFHFQYRPKRNPQPSQAQEVAVVKVVPMDEVTV